MGLIKLIAKHITGIKEEEETDRVKRPVSNAVLKSCRTQFII